MTTRPVWSGPSAGRVPYPGNESTSAHEEVPAVTSQPDRDDRPFHGGYPAPGAPDASFQFYRELDSLGRQIESHGRRMDHLDEHGSRGVDALKTQIEQIRKDFLDHENMHTEAARQAQSARRWLIGVVVALITPLYPVLFVLWGVRS